MNLNMLCPSMEDWILSNRNAARHVHRLSVHGDMTQVHMHNRSYPQFSRMPTARLVFSRSCRMPLRRVSG